MREYSTKNTKSFSAKRIDASANRLTIIKTARKLFKEKGPDTSLSEIAKAAKVSRATLYRNFQDKSDLVFALMLHNMEELNAFAQGMEQDEHEFFILIKKTAELQLHYQGLIPYLPESTDDLNNSIINLMKGPVKRAKERGILMENFDPLTDTALIVTMLGSATLQALEVNLEGMMNRAVEIVFKGISPKS